MSEPADEKMRKAGYYTPVDPVTDTSTDAGMLRYQIQHLKEQEAKAHDRINDIARAFRVDVPIAASDGFRYIPAYRLELLYKAIYEHRPNSQG